MKIGLDLDGVVFNTEIYYKIWADIYNKKIAHGKIINKKEIRIQEKYSWTDEEIDDFFNKYEKIVQEKAPLMPMANEVLKILQDYGCKFYVITGRENNEIERTLKRLNELEVKIEDVFFNEADKSGTCKKNQIDYVIEDYYSWAIKLAKNGIKCLFFNNTNFKYKRHKNLIEVHDWGDVFLFFENLFKKGE